MTIMRLDEQPASTAGSREDIDPLLLPPDQLAALLRDAPWRSLAVVGDSLAEGIGEPTPGYRPRAWAYRMADALGAGRPEFRYLNVAKMNARVAEVADEQLQRALDFDADLVVVVAGGNDLWSSRYDPEVLEAGLEGLVAPFRAAGADVVLFTLMDITKSTALGADPEGAVAARLAGLAEMTRRVAARQGALLVEFADDPACAADDMYASDAIHASARGHAYVASETLIELARIAASRAQHQPAPEAARA